MLTLAAGKYDNRFAIVFNELEGEEKLEEEVINGIELKIYYDKKVENSPYIVLSFPCMFEKSSIFFALNAQFLLLLKYT